MAESINQKALEYMENLEEETPKFKDAIETEELVLKLFENIANYPLDEKYKKIKTTNPKIESVIFKRWQKASTFFETVGFNKEGEFYILGDSSLGNVVSLINEIRNRIKFNYEVYEQTDEGMKEKQEKEKQIQHNLQQLQKEQAIKQQANASKIIQINGAQDFQAKVLNSDKPVIVDFYADWCPPCKKLAALIETEIQNSNGWLIAKINGDNPLNKPLSASHQVSGIPAIFLYHKGQLLREFSFTGFNPMSLQKMIQKASSLC
ncbi:hypothetical protein ABPG74_002440 [Tetrahymena malaccensis]